MRDDDDAVEWTPGERAKLDALPRDRVASDTLRARTVDELRRRQLVGHREHAKLRSAVWLALGASVVFVAGGLAGYRLALTRLEARARLATVASDPSADSLISVRHVVWF
jgi:hypothetical protein